MGIVKVILNGVTKMDITPTTADANEVNQGEVFFNRSGEQSVGTGDPPSTRVPNYGKGKNLLDNAYFVNPINQRGQSSYTGSIVYGISRWRTNPTAGSKMEIGTGVVTVSETGSSYGGINQVLRKDTLLGKTVTLSVLYKRQSGGVFSFGLRQGALNSIGSAIGYTETLSGDIGAENLAKLTVSIPSIVSDSNSIIFAVYAASEASSVDLISAKVELGTEQTLAHQENGIWVLNEVPDYEYELYRCMTSTADLSDTYANKSVATEQQTAYVENGTTASRAYAVGEYFCKVGLLYRVTTPIASGGTITPGTNCVQTTVMEEIVRLTN